MATFPDFPIVATGNISTCFAQRGISTFANAAEYIKNLPYGRNADKENLQTVFTDQCGTCSTKHAVLRLLAYENDFHGLKLALGIFCMNAQNSPKIRPVLEKYDLAYVPEAHNYLIFNSDIIDITFPGDTSLDFKAELLDECTIEPHQITAYKVAYHKAFLDKWLKDNPNISYTLDELWQIREYCIAALSGQNFINKT